MGAIYFPPVISSIYLEELTGQAIDAKDAALVALNAAYEARDTALEYRNDAHTYYTQVQQIQEGDYVTNLSLESRLGDFNFSDLQGIPATFAPSAHGHSWSEIANKPTMYPPTAHVHTWGEITGKPTEFEPLPHIHTWQQIAQKPGTFPPETHFHSWNEIENKPSVFNPSAHTHSWGDISGKPTKFDPAAHTHTWDLIENKPLTFPPQSHHHHWSQITGAPAFIEVGKFGVGGGALGLPNNNADTMTTQAGTYGLNSADISGTPSFAADGVFLGGGSVLVHAIYDANNWGQTLYAHNAGNDTIYFRTKDGGVLTPWREVIHTGNTNFNEFGGYSVGDLVCPTQGFAESATQISFLLPINSTKLPTGISVQGSFRLYNVTIGAYEENDVVPVFNSGGISSNRAAHISFFGLTGKTRGHTYLLASTVGSIAKVKVNF